MLITPEELAIHSLSVAETYGPDGLDYGDGTIRQAGRLSIQVVAAMTGVEIRLQGHVATLLETQCHRCATPINFPVDRSFDLYYRPLASIAREEEVEIPADELELGFYSEDGIDLLGVAKEQVLLALPMKLLCKPDCQGLCAVCGANLNLESCRCARPQSASPFAFLSGRTDQ